MAYNSLVSLAKHLDEILDHRFCNLCRTRGASDTENCILLQKKQRIQSLHQNIVSLLNFPGDFAREAGNLEERVANAANRADNLFHNGRFLINRYPQVSADLNSEAFCRELEMSIAETDLIREETAQIQSSRKTRMPLRMEGDGVVAIEEDLVKIKGRLCGASSQLGIIPIAGMGGIGKTTLARYAFNDPLSVYHFDVRVWVTISQSYSLKQILATILRCIKEAFENVEGESFDERQYWRVHDELLKENVYRYLKGRRYLIVMDDLWDTNLWDDLRRMFPDDLNGSRIIVTTRELNVASYIDSLSHPHQMRLMSVDQSWRLLKERVFGQDNCPLELEKIGQVIAEKCRGLPLAIVVIAGVLSCKVKRRKDSWKKIARNVSKAAHTNDEEFVKILSLSYMYLPSRLRPCFLYMACFPEDYEISVSKLSRLWGAEGFLASNELKDTEELGYEYLEDLVTRSLVLINKKGSDGKIRTVKIHDLLRDLCLRKCEDENFLCTINEFSGSFPQGIENSKRLSVFCNISGCVPNKESSSMHTLLLFKHWAFGYLKKFRRLKVLDGLSVAYPLSTSVVYIRELIHLRYLALTCESTRGTLRHVSKVLYQLHNLQTLICRIFIPEIGFESAGDYFRHQEYMIFEIWRMPQLRHLILLDGFLPDPTAENESFQEISSLGNLHTLSRMKDLKCSERFLEMITNLKKLGVVYSYEATYEIGWSVYGLNNLVHLHRLEKLSLYAEPYPNLKDDLSQNIAFPVSLKKLSLSGCRLPWEDMSMIGLLPNLQVLKLKRRACLGAEWETSEGEFCQLKVLLIDSTNLIEWITESSHFPKLERLTLYECNDLREIPPDIGEIATLELIEVDIRNPAMVESASGIQKEQESYGNDTLQVRVLKSRSWSNFTRR